MRTHILYVGKGCHNHDRNGRSYDLSLIYSFKMQIIKHGSVAILSLLLFFLSIIRLKILAFQLFYKNIKYTKKFTTKFLKRVTVYENFIHIWQL